MNTSELTLSNDTKICQNCKHWGEQDEKLKNLRVCRKVEMFWDSTTWQTNDDETCERVLKEEYKDNLSFVQDGSDYHAKLLTMNNFGCNQFAEK